MIFLSVCIGFPQTTDKQVRSIGNFKLARSVYVYVN